MSYAFSWCYIHYILPQKLTYTIVVSQSLEFAKKGWIVKFMLACMLLCREVKRERELRLCVCMCVCVCVCVCGGSCLSLSMCHVRGLIDMVF